MIPADNSVIIDGPKNLFLPPQHLAVILDALAELPFKKAAPVINDVMAQLRMQAPKPAADPGPPAPPVESPKEG